MATEVAPKAAEANLCWLLSRASYTLTTRMTAELEGLGISPRAHHVLAKAITGEHTQTELARKIGLDKTTMVVTVDELEAAGLAERRRSPHDRRAHMIAVTAAGREKVRQGEEIAARVQAEVLAALPAEHRDTFLESLCQLVTDPLAEPVPCGKPVRQRAPR
jgi:MarR family transcriptional regulator, transcriptional regulator for hemolysin